jgi:DNA adenine methylase
MAHAGKRAGVQYMGGKTRIARRIVDAILADTDCRDVWFEPFVGGANVLEVAAPHFERLQAYDAHLDLILMWSHATSGGPVPESVTREEYAALRHADPSWLRGFVGFGASFGGKWFGGYAGPYTGSRAHLTKVAGSSHVVMRQAAVFARTGVEFSQARFGEVAPPAGSVVYCDPPYAGTTGYSTGVFDHATFYATLAEWAAGSAVYVSEYAVPDDVRAKSIWSGRRRMFVSATSNNEDRTENLFRILP